MGFACWIETDPEKLAARDPVCWNPFNKVVQDHRDGEIHYHKTNDERAARGLPVPWTPDMGSREVHQSPVW
jgi:hypothetical protein